MAQPLMVVSERQRKLQPVAFAESSILTRDLPRDTVLKHLLLRLSGSTVTTFGSGTPVAAQFGIFDAVCPRIDVIVNGNRTVKNVKPVMLQYQQMFTTLIRGEMAASAGASIATDNYPTADVTAFPYGSTTNITTCRETVVLSFENVYARQGKESTWLNLKGVSSAEIRFTTAALAGTSGFGGLLGFGNTAPVVFSSTTFSFDIITVEAQDVPPEARFFDWRQTTKQVTFSAQVSDNAIDINRGNRLQALMLLTRNGAAGSATTATGKLASSLVMTDLSLWINGQTIVKKTDFKALQAENRARFGLSAPTGSNITFLDGVAYFDFLSDDSRGDLNTAIDARPPRVDSLQLYVSTNTSSNTSYTNPVSVEIMTEELVEVA